MDESGDLGFSAGQNSSKYFVITVLITEDRKSVEKIVKKTHSMIRRNVKKLSGGVLHCYKEHSRTRIWMLNKISKLNIQIATIYIEKSNLSKKFDSKKHELYNYFSKALIDVVISKKIIDLKSNINIFAERRETSKFLNSNFKNYIKSELSNKHSLKFNIQIKLPSEEKSLQAVDFISWSIFRYFDRKDDMYYKIIKKKIILEEKLSFFE
jgi:hypothetical protein